MSHTGGEGCERRGTYPWYETVSGEEDLGYGDTINLYPIIVPFGTIELGTISAEVIKYDVVIMSQTCDFVQRKLDLVLVCPTRLYSRSVSQEK